jgi:hypothetical protein
MMRALTAEFFTRHPQISFGALGAAHNADALDLSPFGCQARYFDAERHPGLVERYRAANLYSFPGELALPGWVLSDLYLMPGAIGLLICPATELKPPVRKRLELHPDDEAIAAAYVAAPSVTPGLFVGVSLISLLPGMHAGAWVKSLTLKMLRATKLRGIAQWSNPSLRVHTRMGPMRVVGAVPGTHEFRARSFVYESNLADEGLWGEAMARRLSSTPTQRIKNDDAPALAALLKRAEEGETILLVPPGLDASGYLLVHEGPPESMRPGAARGRPPDG